MAARKVTNIISNAGGPAFGAVAGAGVAVAGAASALPAIGFGAEGVTAGSVAAAVQSSVYGAAVPAGSWFATATSVGAAGTLAPLVALAAPVGAVAGCAAWYYVKR